MDGINDKTPYLIPVGRVIFQATDSVVQQVLFGHAINRFPGGMYSPTGLPTSIDDIKGGVMSFRGYWTESSLSGLAFYDGDVVVDDSTINETYYVATAPAGAVTERVDLYGQYIYIGGANVETVSPANNLTNWLKIGMVKFDAP